MPADRAMLSRVIVVWTGYQTHPSPQQNDAAVIAVFGEDEAIELLPALRALEDVFFGSTARFTAPDLISMGDCAAADFRAKYPEISEAAVQALAWSDMYTYK